MLLHYLGKLKNQKFALCMHVKHVWSVIFYHLSNRYLPNDMKISAKINTMHNINILFFVRLLSLTNWKNAFCAMVRFPTGHHWHCIIDQCRKRLQACVHANGGHLNTFREQTLANNLHFWFFVCFWFNWLLSIVSDFYCVDAWWSISVPCLTAKL